MKKKKKKKRKTRLKRDGDGWPGKGKVTKRFLGKKKNESVE